MTKKGPFPLKQLIWSARHHFQVFFVSTLTLLSRLTYEPKISGWDNSKKIVGFSPTRKTNSKNYLKLVGCVNFTRISTEVVKLVVVLNQNILILCNKPKKNQVLLFIFSYITHF